MKAESVDLEHNNSLCIIDPPARDPFGLDPTYTTFLIFDVMRK